MHLDDRHVLEIADVGHADFDRVVDARTAVVGRRCARCRRMPAFLDLLSRRDAGGRDIGIDGKNQRSLRHLVAHLDLDVLHHAVDR